MIPLFYKDLRPFDANKRLAMFLIIISKENHTVLERQIIALKQTFQFTKWQSF